MSLFRVVMRGAEKNLGFTKSERTVRGESIGRGEIIMALRIQVLRDCSEVVWLKE